MKLTAFLISVLFLSLVNTTTGQDLLSRLDEIQSGDNETTYTKGTFNNVRLINGYTSETAAKKELYFSISHRFNNVNLGIYDFFGLDQSTIRLGLEYGLTDRIDIGFGRSNYEKLYDGFVKIKIARQSSGSRNFPISITWLEGMSVKTVKWLDSSVEFPFTGRLYYVHELFIARKFNDRLSLQLAPVIVHRNMVEKETDQNIAAAMGIGGSLKLSRRLAGVCEYYYLLPGSTSDNYINSFSAGVEIETGGGHTFQLHLTNSSGMTEKGFVPETTRKWEDGDIIFGFNIIRLFSYN